MAANIGTDGYFCDKPCHITQCLFTNLTISEYWNTPNKANKKKVAQTKQKKRSQDLFTTGKLLTMYEERLVKPATKKSLRSIYEYITNQRLETRNCVRNDL